MKTIYKIILGVIALSTIMISCGQEETKYIFNEPVEFKINLNAWDSELRTAHAVKIYTTPRAEGRYIGRGGLLVISNPTEIITANVYGLYAYDLSCPYEKSPSIRLTIDDRPQAICPKCKSTFNIIDGLGTKLSGPSETGLQRYRALNSNSNPDIFHITR